MTTSTPASGGARGALTGAARRARGLLGQVETFGILLVLFGAITMIIKKNWTGDFWSQAVWFGIALGIAAVLYEMISARKIANAMYNAKAGALLAGALLWVCAAGYSVNQWIGAASENQAEKTNVHKAAYLKTITSQDELKAAKSDYERLQKRLDWMATAVNGNPVRTPEAAQASMDNAKSHKFWATTEGCTATKGPKTRTFCDGYRSAEAELTLAIERGTIVEELAEAKNRYQASSTKVSETPVESNEARNDLMILTDWFGLSELDAGRANGLLSIIAISIFLTYASMSQEWQRLSHEGPRKRFNFGLRIRRMLSKLWTGGEPDGVQIIRETHHHTDLKAARAIIDALGPRPAYS